MNLRGHELSYGQRKKHLKDYLPVEPRTILSLCSQGLTEFKSKSSGAGSVQRGFKSPFSSSCHHSLQSPRALSWAHPACRGGRNCQPCQLLTAHTPSATPGSSKTNPKISGTSGAKQRNNQTCPHGTITKRGITGKHPRARRSLAGIVSSRTPGMIRGCAQAAAGLPRCCLQCPCPKHPLHVQQ